MCAIKIETCHTCSDLSRLLRTPENKKGKKKVLVSFLLKECMVSITVFPGVFCRMIYSQIVERETDRQRQTDRDIETDRQRKRDRQIERDGAIGYRLALPL